MPLSLRRGTVTAIAENHEGPVRCEVDDEPCIAYPELTGPVAVGDEVIVNVQARELGLGSGGFDVVHANLTRGLGLPPPAAAHVMKLPYTPVQHAVRHVEEDEPLAEVLAGLPVVCCSLHSQLAPACAALAGLRVAYVQVAGGALPLPLSDTVRVLRERGLIGATVSAGACFGGELESVTAAAALAWAAGRKFGAVVCAIGPGIVGTASRLGHGGLAAAEAATPRRRCKARPCSPCASRAAIRGSAIRVSRITHGRSSSSASGRSGSPGPPGSTHPTGSSIRLTSTRPAGGRPVKTCL